MKRPILCLLPPAASAPCWGSPSPRHRAPHGSAWLESAQLGVGARGAAAHVCCTSSRCAHSPMPTGNVRTPLTPRETQAGGGKSGPTAIGSPHFPAAAPAGTCREFLALSTEALKAELENAESANPIDVSTRNGVPRMGGEGLSPAPLAPSSPSPSREDAAGFAKRGRTYSGQRSLAQH